MYDPKSGAAGHVARVLVCALLSLATGSVAARAAEPAADNNQSDKAIRATAAAFVEAFNRGSAKDVAALWTADGSLADEEGEVLKGRTAIEAKYAAFFKEHVGAKMKITIKSIEFPTPLVAVEDGVAEVESAQAGPPAASRYTAVHSLTDGKWLMASVRETAVDVPSNYGHLQDLEWLVGKWKATSDDVVFESTFRWIANKSFIQRDYVTRRGESAVASGTQIIGWDPPTGRVRSWSFDSSGGYGTGYWWITPEGYRIQSAGVQADGTPTSSIEAVIRVPLEPNVLGWRSVARRIGGIEFPDTPEIVFDRVIEKK